MTTSKRIEVTVEGGILVGEDSGGDGPAILALPGLGDLRAEYRFLAPLLTAAGFRVIAMDLRGHGESSATFDSFTPEDVGRDAIAVLDHLEIAKATLMGTSFAAAAVVWAQATYPERVDRLVMLGPFTRDMPADRWMRPLLWLFFNRLWGVAMWIGYWKRLFKDAPPADLDEQAAALGSNLKEKGRLKALRGMMKASKQGATDVLAEVTAPTLIFMGDKDPDFKVPAEEAHWLADALGGTAEVKMIEGAGHYPQVEQPAGVADAIIAAAAADLRLSNAS